MPAGIPPLFKKIDFFEDPFQIYQCFKGEGPSVLLESARASSKMGRYSIIAKNPFLVFESKGIQVTLRVAGETEVIEKDPLEVLRALLKRFAVPPHAGAPPFLGGAIGYFGYEAKNLMEPSLSQEAKDDIGLPDIYLLFFDEGIVLDHEKRELWLFAATGKKIKRLEDDLMTSWNKKGGKSGAKTRPVLEKRPGRIESSLDRASFQRQAQKAKRYIEQGEIYQANLSQRFSFPVRQTALQIYQSLRSINPSSFFGILDAGSFQIISGSPERLVKLEDGVLETRPIAGTRSRGKTAAEDSAVALDLILNEKERAEHIMLVDLERNDLGRVSEFGSVAVDELMALEDYSHVKHIVSNIRGVLRRGLDSIDVLKAFFPGGTITGAPKIRCMEIIDELEPVARGPYTGSLGYLSFTGNMDLNIIIRSLILKDKRGYLQVGAGIVADSIPRKEYDETLYKAEAILSALFGKDQTAAFLEKCRV